MKNIMNEEIYQKICDILVNVLPEKWENIVFKAEYGEESYEMKYWVDSGNGELKDCFELAVVPKSQMVKTFIALNKVIAPERNALEPKHKWKIMTLKVSSKGKFNADFEY
ncbi:MAG: DUF600 family protein [Candidatus Riflebacteria bacterium]|nr:DUF600 family protein [Candidatus Riflebacteria bacterium]